MIALKRLGCCEVIPLTTSAGSTKKSLWLQEDAPVHNGYAQMLEGSKPTLRLQETMTSDNGGRKGPRVLEERLLAVRKELAQSTKDHNRLLDIARTQAERLAIIEPMPGLFLSRVEDVLRLVEQNREESSSDESAITPEELNRRFNQAIAKLRLVLDRDHILENQELRETLTQIQSALAVKREEAMGLQVEQEQLTQRLATVMDTLKRFNVEASTREQRIAKLQLYVKESEARHHRLFVNSRSMKDKKNHSFNEFTFMTGDRRRSTTKQRQRWSQFVSLVVGLTLGCVLTIMGGILAGYDLQQFGFEWQQQVSDSVNKSGYGSINTTKQTE